MEAVRAFNSELSSLYESRPPVSRAKMASVTKAAIKAIKFYKHVVQSVEKFIMKCKPEYKVPGLYVIDSVVRQSRHQFGGEKDVFGPRFTKNIVTTFQSLLKCPNDEQGRVIRVLNLWQKNSVFPVDVIQALLDIAADPKNMDLVLAAQRAVEKVVLAHQRSQGKATNGGTEDSLLAQQSDIVNTVTKLLQQTGEGSLLASGQEGQLQQLQLLQQQLVMHTEMMSSKSQHAQPLIDNNLLAQIKLLTDQLLSKTDAPASGSGSQSAGMNMSEGGRRDEGRESQNMHDGAMDSRGRDYQNMMQSDMGRDMKRPAEPGFNKKLLDFDYGDSDEDDDRKDGAGVQHLPGGVHKLLSDPSMMQHIHNVSALKSDQLRADMSNSDAMRKQHLEQEQEQFNKEIGQSQYSGFNEMPDVILVENPDAIDRDYDRNRRQSRRSRDRSRSPRRRGRSRSRSRERRRSRDRHRRSRSRDQDRERQREKERERKKKGLPPIREKHLSICSTTLWFGHLAKYTSEEELKAEIENYGTTESIKMVPPRGCAFVTMTYRKEAAKALDRMKGFKLNSSALRVAWAPNIGVKESQYKDLWDADLGVTYIPWERMPANLNPLLNGAMIDEDTLPEHLKGTGLGQEGREKEEKIAQAEESRSSTPPSNNMMSAAFGVNNQPGMPSAQQMSMIPPPMMMPPPGQMPPGVQIPPPSVGQLPLPGQLLPGQNNHPQGLPPNLLHPSGAPVSTPISLPAGVSLTQMVSAAASLLGVSHNLPNSNSGHNMGMDSPLPRPPVLDRSSPMIMPSQQPGIITRPGFPQGSPFGLPPNIRPGLPMLGQGIRPPFQMEEPKEWPSDDKLEEEALAEMEEDDMDQPLGPAGGPTPIIPLQLMRMGVPRPGAPRMSLELPPNAPRPGMMMDLRQPVSSSGMPMIPSSPLARPGLIGPRLIQPGTPQEGPEGMIRPAEGMIRPAEGMMRPQLPQGLIGQGAMGVRMGMNSQGPQGLSPANLTLGQRLGMPGSPGMRPPIRIVLGQRPNLVRPGGPFSLENPRLQLSDIPSSQAGRGMLDDGPPSAPGPIPNNGPPGPRPMPNLMMRASLAEGRPGLLGPRPNLPMGGGMRFGPGAMNFRGPRPDMIQGPGMDKSPVVAPNMQGLLTPFGGGVLDNQSPKYGEGGNSPEYGQRLKDGGGGKMAAQDTDLRGDMDLRGDTDLRGDMDLRPKDMDLRKGGVGSGGATAVSEPDPPSAMFPQEDLDSAFPDANQSTDAGEGSANG